MRTVPGDERAFKITTSADLDRARGLVSPIPPVVPAAPVAIPRVGIGTDVHAVGGNGTLWLAGLEWPGEPGLHGHSDGDAVAHAIVDAVLAGRSPIALTPSRGWAGGYTVSRRAPAQPDRSGRRGSQRGSASGQ